MSIDTTRFWEQVRLGEDSVLELKEVKLGVGKSMTKSWSFLYFSSRNFCTLTVWVRYPDSYTAIFPRISRNCATGQRTTRRSEPSLRTADAPDPNKAGNLEQLWERALLKEFEEYRASKQRNLKVFRLEAFRAGFKKAWQERDYTTIITMSREILESVLQEEPKNLMWYDQTLTRGVKDA